MKNLFVARFTCTHATYNTITTTVFEMSRWNLLILLVVCPVLWTGCSLCCGPYDYEYPMMDNPNYTRMDPEYGRVGSIYSDPSVVIGPAPKTNADIPIEEDPEDELDEELPDDPNFDLDTETSTTPELDPFTNEIDTSASLRGSSTRR